MSAPTIPWPPSWPGDPTLGTIAATLAVAGALLVVLVGALTLTTRRRADRTATKRDGRRLERVITNTAAAIAMGGALTGMLRVFEDHLHMSGPELWVLAGFLEMGVVACGIRARRRVRQGLSVGVDGAAVWAFAMLSASLSASTETDHIARAARFVIPMVAALLWWRDISSDREHRPTTGPIAWRWTPSRVLVAIGLADPTHRDDSDVASGRRLARLTRARIRVAVLETTTVPVLIDWATLRGLRLAVARWRLQRCALAAVEHDRLGDDPAVATRIRGTVAAVVGLHAATDPAALRGAYWDAAPDRGDAGRGPARDTTDAPTPGVPSSGVGDGGPDADERPARPHLVPPPMEVTDEDLATARTVIASLTARGDRLNLENFGAEWRGTHGSIAQQLLRAVWNQAKTTGVA